MTEEERVKEFEAAYNRIDRALAEMAGKDREERRRTFSSRVRVATHRYRRLQRFKDFLIEVGQLRNAIVHNRTGDDLYLAVPSQRTLDELKEVERRIVAPSRVIPKYARQVVILAPDQTLLDAWSKIRDIGYSRYPVYGRDGFVGLLTPNGFTRWCAERVDDGILHVDTRKVKIADVLKADHRRDQAAFVDRNTLIDDVEELFNERHPLEAVLITEHGRSHEKPLGLICAADLMERGD